MPPTVGQHSQRGQHVVSGVQPLPWCLAFCVWKRLALAAKKASLATHKPPTSLLELLDVDGWHTQLLQAGDRWRQLAGPAGLPPPAATSSARKLAISASRGWGPP